MTVTIFTNQELADCARTEAGHRQKVYPGFVANGAINKRQAARRIAKMLAIAAHFDELEEEDRGP